MIQRRIYELDIYQQLAPGEEGYVDPATIGLAVDKNGWTLPKQMSLVDFLSTHHIETETISPTNVSVSVTYNSAFNSGSYYFAELQVYKIIAIPGVGNVRENIPYHDLLTTVNGFSLTLAEIPVETVYLTYFASEPSINSVSFKDYIYATGSVAGLVVPTSGKVQITGLTHSLRSGIVVLSSEFTVSRTGIYSVDFRAATFNKSASNVLSIDVYDDANNPLGITKQFVPRNDYDQIGVNGLLSLSENDKVRFYLSAAGTGLTLSLSTITVNIVQI